MNYPDGMRSSELDGYTKYQDVEMTCQNDDCRHTWVEDCESEEDGEIESGDNCEKCGSGGIGVFTAYEDARDAYADAYWNSVDADAYWDR